jgi:hypothetical protein
MKPSICGECYKRIDLRDTAAAIEANREYRHGCGRVLIRPQAFPVPSLLETHRARLIRSAISEEVMAARGYVSVVDEVVARRLRHASTPLPAIDIPWYGVDGEVAHHQLRPDSPSRGRDGRLVKYPLPPRTRNVLDIHPAKTREVCSSSEPLFVTEGVLKGDSLLSDDGEGLSGHSRLTISLNGVWGWKRDRGPLPDWDAVEVKGRTVAVVFDSDLRTNPSTHEAARQLEGFLTDRGASVRVKVIDEAWAWRNFPDLAGATHLGIDDLNFAGGTVDMLPTLEEANEAIYRDVLEWIAQYAPTRSAERVAETIVAEARRKGGTAVEASQRYLMRVASVRSFTTIQKACDWMKSDRCPPIQVTLRPYRNSQFIHLFVLRSKDSWEAL